MKLESIHIVGAGLIGGSVSLRLSELGIRHSITDSDKSAIEILKNRGISVSDIDPELIDLVFVAVPPDQALDEILAALKKYPNAIVSDLSSVKSPFEKEISRDTNAHRYVGSHPMAGKEFSGAEYADSSLFVDRIWIVCQNQGNLIAASSLSDFLFDFGAIPVYVPAEEHDLIVAYVSHLPQLLSSVLAEVTIDSGANLEVAGPAFRDMTRIARSNPNLWTQIIRTNQNNIVKVIDKYLEGLKKMREVIDQGSETEIQNRLTQSSLKAANLPGKHGGKLTQFAVVKVVVPDEPGALAAVFSMAGKIDLNIEDVSIDHVLNRPLAILSLQVSPQEYERARSAFRTAGWEIRE